MIRKPLSRRALLSGAGGIAIGLPMLEAMLPPSLHAAPAGKRFISFFSGCGVVPETFFPIGTETNFVLPASLKPLDKLKARLMFFDGIINNSGNDPQYGGHQGSHVGMISGAPFVVSDVNGSDHYEKMRPTGVSLDQAIAQKIAKNSGTKFPSIQLGILNGQLANKFDQCASFTGEKSLLSPVDKVSDVFDQLFKDLTIGGGDSKAAEFLRLKRKSILDNVLEQYATLKPKLSGDDLKRIDQHMTSIREVELQLTSKSSTSNTCKVPGKPVPTLSANGNLKAYAQAQFDLLAMAMACDLTRVASLTWFGTRGGNYDYNTLVPGTGAHHSLSHDKGSDAKITLINAFIAENFALLLSTLDKYKDESGGSLLDNTLVLWFNELGFSNAGHRSDPAPFVLGGGAGSSVKMGRFLNFKAKPQSNNNLLLSIYNAITDSEDKVFGTPKYCTGPLPSFA